MTKPRRPDPGQGGLYEYRTKSGEARWYIKLITDLHGSSGASSGSCLGGAGTLSGSLGCSPRRSVSVGTCPADDLPPPIRLHDLRHSHGSQLYLDGHPLKVIAERLGHDEVVLLRTYTHLSSNSQEEMIRRTYGQVAGP